MEYKRYPTYRDSGVKWLGSIPSGWSVKKTKYLVQIRKRIAGKLGYDVLSITQSGIRVKDIESGEGQVSMDYSKYQLVEPGDFAMNHMDLLTGWVDISPYAGVTSPDYRVFSMEDVEASPNYFLYLFQMGYLNRIFYAYGQGSSHLGRWRFPTSRFENFFLPYPDPEEQLRIANYLDRETARIDVLIEKKQRLIELLKEKRQAVITQAVTKGLDPNVAMKDSGVEWLGEVPEHWEVVKFNVAVGIRNGQVDPREEPYTDFPLIAPNHIESGTGRILAVETAAEQGADSGKYLCKPGEVIYSKIRPALAKACIAPSVSLCSADMYPLDARGGLTNEFLLWFLLSMPFTLFAILESERVAMPKVNRETLGLCKVPVPPRDEQKKIVDEIHNQTTRIDGILGKTAESVELLREHRAALITAAVTGQIDVRDAA